MRTANAFHVGLTVFILVAIIIDVYAAELEPSMKVQQINNTSALEQIPSSSTEAAKYKSFNFAFGGWGAYGGYLIDGKRYLQDYGSSQCWPRYNLPLEWSAEVIFDANVGQNIKQSQSLDLLEGYRLIIKSIDPKGSKISLELRRSNEVIDSQVLLLEAFPSKGACNTYYYGKDLIDLAGATVQKKFPIIAVHFRSISGSSVAIDGIWQIRETIEQRCLSHFCPEGASCKGGNCICPQNQILCSGKCVKEDKNNCGISCRTCPAIANGEASCISGSCGLASCNMGYEDCDTSLSNGCEIDLLRDNKNCGECGRKCDSGKTCCSGACVDTAADNNNCGGCGIVCTGGKECDNNSCVCPKDRVDCNGSCIDLKSDNKNCGTCGGICDKGQTCCNGVCVDTLNDSYNCGGCRKICSACGTCNAGNCIPQAANIYVDRDHPDPASRRYPSIQAAINSADNCIIIHVPGGTYHENLAVVDKSLVILGANKDNTTIDGSSSPSSVFDIKQDQKPTDVILADMKIQNGKPDSGSGGGIHVGRNAALRIKDCIVSRNNATNGGGICTDEDSGALMLMGCNISSNHASGDGGGIAAGGNVTVIDSAIKDNQAGRYGGAIGLASSRNNNTLEITQNSIISGNTAGKYGGGIYWNGDLSGPVPLLNITSRIAGNYPDDIFPPIYLKEKDIPKPSKKRLENSSISYSNWQYTYNQYVPS